MPLSVLDMDLRRMAKEVLEVNTSLGWRGDPAHPEPPFSDAMMLLSAEIAEAADAWRKWTFADATHLAPDNECWCGASETTRCKPEGVGSEFADILIRLLDDCDLFGVEIDRHYTPNIGRLADTFLSECLDMTATVIRAEIAHSVMGGRGIANIFSCLLHQLLRSCDVHGIDLMAEYERKLAYNRTRSWRHGGKLA